MDVKQVTRAGLFISFEGTDGVGKSTQIAQAQHYFELRGYDVVLVREPGCTEISEQIREILLNPNNKALNSRAELLLYEAARAQLVEERIKPALFAGKVVLADRFFDSTSAYQGYGRGLSVELIDQLNLFATDNIVPDLTLWLNNDAEQALERARVLSGAPDRLEDEGSTFMLRVQAGFLSIAQTHPERVKLIDAHGSIEEVAARITHELDKLLSLHERDS